MTEKVNYIFDDGTKIFFVSDTHANHANIIKFCNRPFNDVQEMNDEMVKRWNEKVPNDGIVFHLGDFAWGGYNVWKNFREQLNGEIYLIKGNHCLKNMTSTAKELFKDTQMQMRIEVEGRKIWLNHFPFLCYSGTYRDTESIEYNLFGHTHLSNHLSRNNGKDCERCFNNLFSTQYDVGVDFNEFAPISWHEVDEKIKEQIKTSKNLSMWVENT